MKPFIIPDISTTGQKVFRLQCENIEPEKMPKYVQDLSVVAYSMPVGHSFQAAWIFRLIFSNGSSLEFSSACTMVDGWQEVGSLNIQLINQSKSDIDSVLVRVEVPPFRVTTLVKLVYEDNSFRSECGIAVGGENEEEIVVATGVSPGSVSIAAPFSTSPFEPEFPVSECSRELLYVP
ncbi:hypothetical protein [Hydrogenophaga sp. 5NK40-0174]|uniref:hypothetical protein n=1 Tax=Hydrogenophaga sp. 5NK40-0174 TaxID=3127649 RepID=UPI0033412F6A